MTITSPPAPPVPTAPPPDIFAAALSARLIYEAAVDAPGMTRDSWLRIAAALHETADALEQALTVGIPPGYILTAGMVECQRRRATDASHRASTVMRTRQSIPVVSL